MSNTVQGGQSYTLPSKDLWFILDENIGMETVFVLASKHPIDDIKTFVEFLEGKGIQRVKLMLARKADVVKSISFRHIE